MPSAKYSRVRKYLSIQTCQVQNTQEYLSTQTSKYPNTHHVTSIYLLKNTCHECDRIESHSSIPQYLHPPRFNRRSRRRQASDAVATVGENAGNTVTRVMKRENDSAYCEETRARIARRRRRGEIAISAERRIKTRSPTARNQHSSNTPLRAFARRFRRREASDDVATVRENAGNTATRVMMRENDSAYCEETRAGIARRRAEG